MPAPRLVLASASPRRRELLSQAGYRFDIIRPDIAEHWHDQEHPACSAARLALEKATAVCEQTTPAAVVLAADTLVVLEGHVDRIMGKPRDREEAVQMLSALAGRNHRVVTGWALVPVPTVAGAVVTGVAVSTVRMREVTRREAREYAASGEPLDKAGAYALQGEGRRFVAAVIGPVDNVIGLPVAAISSALAGLGVRPGER